MPDGAHLGVAPERALGSILGDEPSPETTGEETLNPAQMREQLEATTLADCTSYDGTAKYCAKLILRYFLAHPEHAQLPASRGIVVESKRREPDDHGIELDPDRWMYPSDSPDLYELVKAASTAEDYERCFSDLTGFMWGWAVNAARYCVELPPTPNPAIITIDTGA